VPRFCFWTPSSRAVITEDANAVYPGSYNALTGGRSPGEPQAASGMTNGTLTMRVKSLKTLDLILSLSKGGARDYTFFSSVLTLGCSHSVDRVTHRSDAGDFALHHIARLQPLRGVTSHADA
jgi:hypothetical protein